MEAGGAGNLPQPGPFLTLSLPGSLGQEALPPWKESVLPTFPLFADLLPCLNMMGGMGGSVLSPSTPHRAGCFREVSSGLLRPQFKVGEGEEG